MGLIKLQMVSSRETLSGHLVLHLIVPPYLLAPHLNALCGLEWKRDMSEGIILKFTKEFLLSDPVSGFSLSTDLEECPTWRFNELFTQLHEICI